MGQPKLMLPLGGRPVIEWLVESLRHPAVVEVVIIVRPDDDLLARASEATGARVVRPPEAPPDMKASVGWGLQDVSARAGADGWDGWLLVPADHPVLVPEVLTELAAAWGGEDEAILVPTCGGRRGHPTLFAWSLAEEVAEIPADAGLNWLVARHAGRVRELELGREEVLLDMDTPEDFAALQRRFDQLP